MLHRGVLRMSAAALVAAGLSGCGGSADGKSNPPPDQIPIRSSDPDSYAWQPLIPSRGSLVLVDRQTGSTFNLRGEAIAGPLAARKRLLRPIAGVNLFWFAWSVFFPGSEIWGRSERVRAAELPSNKTGIPGCTGGRDCIPSLPNTGPPRGDLAWTRPGASDVSYLRDSDLVLGIFVDAVPRAYPHNVLWWHEIANDHIADQRFSVTFCPLTGSGVAWDAGPRGLTFGVSGNLFNSNLVMHDHVTRSLWPQLWMGAVSGSEGGARTWLVPMPAFEMTWAKWKELHPDTLVLSRNTGYTRVNYTIYPYGDYRTNDADTFSDPNPRPDPLYRNKAMTFGLADRRAGLAKAYVHADLASRAGPRSVTNDTLGGRPIVIVYEQAAQLVLAFESQTPEGALTFDGRDYSP